MVLSQWVNAQVPVANFSASPTSGCSPLVVTFKDQSSGDPKFWNWEFGNGQLSNVQNPVVVFPQPGIYSVKLVVKNGNGTHGITKDSFVVVNASPVADFTANVSIGCNPVNVQFTDRSTDGGRGIASWEWDFGDGTKSTQKNPQKTYTVNGFYSVTLTVTSITGCKNTVSKTRFIRIVSGIKADFTNTVDPDCQAPFTVNFKNESAGPGSLTYSWDLGNGSTSTQRNPTSTYNAAGTYSIRLTAVSDFGCSNTIQKDILIKSSNTIIGGPDSICVNKPLNFLNTSTPAPVSSVWYFDDGTQSNRINASKTYSTVGPHVVKLVNTYAFCKDSVTKTIHVLSPPTVDFTSSTVLACKAPLTVNFSDASPTNAVAWAWDFGDGGKSIEKNPVHTYNSPGQFNVSLTVTNSSGCTNSLQKDVFVQIVRPVVKISNIPGEGCIPYTYQPIPAVQTLDGVALYSWDFGDGPGSTRTGISPSYTYTKAGNYTVQLTITTNGGCTETVTYPNGVRTGTPPTVDFTASATSSCASNPIQFTSLATPSTQWLWDFGDGTGDTARNPIHLFEDIGSIPVTHIGYNNGCRASVTKTFTILSPFARFKDTVLNCADRYTVTFLDRSKVNPANNVSYSWKFSTLGTSTAKSPSFTFPGPGNYPVTLTLSDGVTTCTHTSTVNIPLIYETAKFSAPKTTVCKNERFSISASGDPVRISEYYWRLGNGAFFKGSARLDTSLANTGSYAITLVVKNSYAGCTDTLTVPGYITVIGPTAAFTNNTGACLNTSATFTDQSTATSKISKWTWDFGDGTSQSFATGGPFTHSYKDTGTYSVQLTVQDDVGCTHTLLKNDIITIARPQAFFTADTVYCPGVALQFKDSSQGRNLTYSWNFGDGGTSTLIDPTHLYTGVNTSYTVKLKVVDAFGCEDSLTKNNYINIRFPKSAFSVTDTVSICPPLETKFTFQGKDYESYSWDFGDGTGSTLQDPTHFYNTHGTFIAKLYVFGYGGCVDSSSHTVNLYDPIKSTSIAYTAADACNSLNVDFTITTPAHIKFTFLPGDGSADSSQNKTLSHFYNSPNYYLPTVLLSDNVGCQGLIGGPSHIKILGAIPNFGRDRREFCDSGVVYFTNYTIANDPVVSSVWNFDDGSTSIDQDPVHYFARPDQYAVSLTVTTQFGCTSSIVDTIKAYRTPVPSFTNTNPACINTPVAFTGSLAVPDTAISWKWNLGNGQSFSQQNAASVYTTTGTFKISLEAANRLGCKNSISKDLTVAPLPVITMGPDPVIPVGTGIDLPVTYSGNMILYTWTPTKDLSCTNCAVPFANPKFTTRYKVAVTDSNNCRSSSDITVKVVCTDKNYFVPNTFTPNGDGVNDVFYPRGSSIDRIQSMRVFNRWGQVVFENKNFTANNLSEGWNGTFQGRPANTDTYIYTIEFVCENGEIIPYKGNVTLLR